MSNASAANFAFVGRYSRYDVLLSVLGDDGQLAIPDSVPVASFRDYGNDDEIFSRDTLPTATTGVYLLRLSSAETETPGLYYIRWSYVLDGISQVYRTDIEIPQSQSSAYEALDGSAKGIIEYTWMRVSDLFDSAIGGPHLREYAQSNFGRDRMAQLLHLALNRLNIVAQPHSSFTLDENGFPYEAWGGLLELALWVETIKHLRRSYIEQPTPQGVTTARLDRKDYSSAWAALLRDEQDDLKAALGNFKMSLLGLGRASVLVGGGIYREWQRPLPPTRPRMMPPVGWYR